MCHSSILNMKLLLILLITCLVGVQSFVLYSPSVKKDLNTRITEVCAKELNTSVDKYEKGTELFDYMAGNADDETVCMVACHIRKLITQKIATELTGSTNKETLYNTFNKLTNIVFKVGFGRQADVKREDVLAKAKNCYAKERTECRFFKCLEIPDSPLQDLARFISYHNFNK